MSKYFISLFLLLNLGTAMSDTKENYPDIAAIEKAIKNGEIGAISLVKVSKHSYKV